MKTIYRVIAALLVLVMFAGLLGGCGKKEEAAGSEATTPATKLAAQFKDEIKNNQNLESVAKKLIKNKAVSGLSMDYVSFGEGYLNGFDSEITGFSKCVMFSPVIGSIPFVGYLFESDNAEALAEQLRETANLRWNICTEADEMVCEVNGSYVFFCMAPNSFD